MATMAQIDAVQSRTSIESQRLQMNSPKGQKPINSLANENGSTKKLSSKSLIARLPASIRNKIVQNTTYIV